MTNGRKQDVSENKPGAPATVDSEKKVGWDDVSRSLFKPADKSSDETGKIKQGDQDNALTLTGLADRPHGKAAQQKPPDVGDMPAVNAPKTAQPPDAGTQNEKGEKGDKKPSQPEEKKPTDEELKKEIEEQIKDTAALQTSFFKPKPGQGQGGWFEYLSHSSLPVSCDNSLQAPGLSKYLRNSCNVDIKGLSAKVDSSVVKVTASDGGALARKGTGFPVCVGDTCTIATNDHVAGKAASVSIQWNRSHEHIREIRTIPVLASKPQDDLAVLTFDASQMPGLKPLKLNTAAPKADETYASIGHPLGIDQKAIGVGKFVQTNTLVKTDRVLSQVDGFTTEAYRGNSGGPLVDLVGDVRGITVLRYGDKTAVPGQARLGAIPAKALENFVKEARAEGKISNAGVTNIETQYYDGVDFRIASSVNEQPGNKLRATFYESTNERALAAVIDTENGETKAEYKNIVVSKDKQNNVTEADTPDGKPIYKVARDAEGNIVKFTQFGPDGKPLRAFERVGEEQVGHREALISNMPFRDIANPPPGKARLSELAMGFNYFREVDPNTGSVTGLSWRKNINITADGIVRTEEPAWNYALTDKVNVSYEAPGRKFSATETVDARTISYDHNVKEVLDKTTGKTSLIFPLGYRREVMPDVSRVSTIKDGEVWASSEDRLVGFNAAGDRRYEHNRKERDFKIYDQKSNKLLATADILGNPVWRFDKDGATTSSGLKFGADTWDLRRPTIDADGSVVLKSIDGKGSVAKLQSGGTATIEQDGFTTRLYENGIRFKALGEMLVEMQTPATKDRPSLTYRPIYENGKMVAMESADKQRIEMRPAGSNYRFDAKTGFLVTPPDSKVTLGGSPTQFRWNPLNQDYIVEKSGLDSTYPLFAYESNFDGGLLDKKSKPTRVLDPMDQLTQRFGQLSHIDLNHYVANPNVPKESARDAYVEILRRQDLAIGHHEIAFAGADLVLKALESGKEMVKTGPNAYEPGENALDPIKRMEYYQVAVGDLLAFTESINTARQLNRFVNAPEFTNVDRANAKEVLDYLNEPKGPNSVKFTDLASRAAAQIRRDLNTFPEHDRKAALEAAAKLESYVPATMKKAPVEIKKTPGARTKTK